LLAQLLMASTYPLDVVQASRWTRDHGDLEGEALEQAAAQESWDPSVQALVFFPDLLARMNDNLDWTQDLGEAYLGQEEEVLDAIQRLRREAHEAGNLESNEHQQVVVEGDTIVVQPAEPEVVYVPSYSPATVYAPSRRRQRSTIRPFTRSRATRAVTGCPSSPAPWWAGCSPRPSCGTATTIIAAACTTVDGATGGGRATGTAAGAVPYTTSGT
jgi:hypothetical protein